MMNGFNVKALATATAIFVGGYTGLAALFASMNVTFFLFSPEVFNMLVSIYPGLSPTIGGVFVGVLWGAVCGAFCGGIFGWLYNWACMKLE